MYRLLFSFERHEPTLRDCWILRFPVETSFQSLSSRVLQLSVLTRLSSIPPFIVSFITLVSSQRKLPYLSFSSPLYDPRPLDLTAALLQLRSLRLTASPGGRGAGGSHGMWPALLSLRDLPWSSHSASSSSPALAPLLALEL